MNATLKIEPARHTAPRSSSTTLNHVRGPSAAAELEQMKAQRAELVARLKTLNAEIAEAELIELVASAGPVR